MKPDLPEKLRMALNARPPRHTALVYQAVILAVSLHLFVLLVLFFSTSAPLSEQPEDEDPRLEEFDLQFVEPEELERAEPPAQHSGSEEVRNLLANAESQRTSSSVNFSSRTREQINDEVMQNLKGLEAEEFNRLRSGRPEATEKVPPPASPENANKVNSGGEDLDWYRNQSEKSYAGPVSAEFSLSGRNTRSTPRPTYRCQSSGKVVVRIEVDPTGNVVSAEIDEAQTTGNNCIREESLTYAKRWKFDYKAEAPRRQPGTVTFLFSSQ